MSDTQNQPAQHQSHQPGTQTKMDPAPQSEDYQYQGANKLNNKVAVITGGDSGIGRAVAYAFAKEGADIVISYLDEHEDAKHTQSRIEGLGKRCVCIAGDVGNEDHCYRVVELAIKEFDHLDILVNNAAEQHPVSSIEEISQEQLERTFRTNIFSYFYMIKAALPHLKEGDAIINTTSVTAYKGSPQLIDYSATKGAIVALTRSLSQSLLDKKIRVNGVAPGPIWTPLIPSSFSAEKVAEFGSQAPLKRVGQPAEIAPSYVFLASKDSSYMSGQILHPNGGTVVNA